VSSRGGQPVEVEKVETDHPALTCTAVPGPGSQVTVKIAIDRTRVSGHVLQSSIRVHVGKPSAEILTVPVTCTLP
jgi:hypothetical protein